MRHRLALDELPVQRRIGRAPAHGEIVGRRDHRPPVDIRAPEDEITRGEVFQLAVLAIAPAPRDIPDPAKAPRIDARVQLRPRIPLPPPILPRDLFPPRTEPARI